ncbi:MAG: hypothetical protein WCJ29_04580 [bacterium]
MNTTWNKALILVSVLIIGLFGGMWVKDYLRPNTTIEYHTNDADEAKGALITFLASLHEKNYAAAVATYGNNYEQLENWNPAADPKDTATLWKYGCEQNGLNCLEVRNAVFDSQPDSQTFKFNVWFSEADKIHQFELQNGTSMFPFIVKKNSAGKYLVETMPVYTP